MNAKYIHIHSKAWIAKKIGHKESRLIDYNINKTGEFSEMSFNDMIKDESKLNQEKLASHHLMIGLNGWLEAIIFFNDLILLDKKLEITMVIIRGDILFNWRKNVK